MIASENDIDMVLPMCNHQRMNIAGSKVSGFFYSNTIYSCFSAASTMWNRVEGSMVTITARDIDDGENILHSCV